MERTIAQPALVFASVLLMAALAGCGGGSQPAPGDGGQMPLPMPTTIELPSGHTLRAGTIPAGASQVVADANGMRTVVMCPAGGAACVVTLTDSGAESRGGALTVTTYTAIAGLPGGHSLAAGTTIPAGGSRQVHDDGRGTRTTVTCAAGGAACVVSARGDGSLESTGGALTVGTTGYTTLADLPSGHTLTSGTIAAGASRVVADANGMRTTVACPAGGEACVITVANGIATSTGGEPTVTTISYTAIQLPSGHTLTSGTIAAGASRVVADADGMRTTVTCPGGEDARDCMVTVTGDSAESTGGRITVATVSYAAIEDLPAGHTLTSNRMIAAGDRVMVKAYSRGRTYFVMCPGGEGAQACDVVVAGDGSVESRGGAATVTRETDEMVWQANNGPDGDSDGAHARGLGGRLVVSGALNGVFTADPTGRDGALTSGPATVQSTLAADPSVTPSMEWTTGDSPELKLTLGSTAFTGLDITGETPNPGELTADSGSVAPELGTGWERDSLSGSFLGKTMRATVYTNAGAPDGYTAGTPQRSVAEGLDLVDESALVTAFGATAPTEEVEFSISSSIGGDVKVKIPANEFTELREGAILTQIPNVRVSYTDADGDTQTANVTMRCVSVTCRGITGSNPRLVGAWDIAIPAVAEVAGTQDPFYVTLGSWLVLPENPAHTDQYNLGVFADGNAGSRLTRVQMDNDIGVKEFEGRATGLYMTGRYSGRGSQRALASAEVDSFTADTGLTADFGASGTVFVGVSGTVTNFMGGNGSPLGWRMTLEDTGDDGGVLHMGDTVLETGTGQSLTGKWGVEFYWDTTEAVPTGRLQTAAGTFSASTAPNVDSALHVVGAFGAARQTP